MVIAQSNQQLVTMAVVWLAKMPSMTLSSTHITSTKLLNQLKVQAARRINLAKQTTTINLGQPESLSLLAEQEAELIESHL